jgi:Flp pilus assembly protein protease CpaA
MKILLLLLLLAVLIAIYDLRYVRIPNVVTLPLLLLGSFTNLPKPWYILFFLAAFLLFWKEGWMGGGDVKLWAGIILFLPATETMLWALPFTFFSTALVQLLWRKIRGEVVTGRRTPAAWRTVVYLLILVGTHAY